MFPKVSAGNEKSRELAPAGNHLSICYMVVDLGLQKTTYQGQEKTQRQLLLGFELCEEAMQDGRPFAVSNTYNFSLGSKANLRRILEGWRGKPFTDEELQGFDVSVLAGKPCMVQVAHRTVGEKTYVNIQSIASVPKSLPIPEAQNQIVVYSPEFDDPLQWSRLPAWVQKRIQDRVKPEPAGHAEGFDDEIPF